MESDSELDPDLLQCYRASSLPLLECTQLNRCVSEPAFMYEITNRLD